MGGRILTMQRHARQLGRLRTGYSRPHKDPNKRPVPVKSKTWVLTSHAEHYVQAAAEAWGGTVERWQPQGAGAPQFRVITEAGSLDALLPPGDPLNSFNEMWSAGGCQRRCNGEFEQISRKPCLCLAQYGEEWYLRPKGTVCAATSRLNVILPDMPDVGVWRAETHSFYAANEWGGTVDMVLSGTNGQGLVPVTLRIEQRTSVSRGQTKNFPVVAVEIRGITPRMALTGPLPTAVALDPGAAPRLAITAGPSAEELLAQARMCKTPAEVFALWQRINTKENAAVATADLQRRFKEISEDIGRGVEPSVPESDDEDEDETVDAEFFDPDDPDEMWAQLWRAGEGLGWERDRTEREFAEAHDGVVPGSAETSQIWAYIAELRKRRPAA
jgi:hypothetical protein